MRSRIFNLFLFLIPFITNGQSILSSAGSKSGMLVNAKNDFAGITYESASDEFSLAYKTVRQDVNLNSSTGNYLPDFIGINIGTSFNVEKGKSSLFSGDKFQGGIGLNATVSYTWDRSSVGSAPSSGWNNVGADIKQHTAFIRVEDRIDRINVYKKNLINDDTTFISIDDPISNTFLIGGGYFYLQQFDNSVLSVGVSINLSFLNNSTRKLTKSNFQSNAGEFFLAKDSSNVISLGKEMMHFEGKPESELYSVPRVEVFYRHSLGDDQPYLGIFAVYSPLISSFNIDTRHAISFGPTIGLSDLPDQVLFGILNEFIQDGNGEFKYSLNFQVSYPIIFK